MLRSSLPGAPRPRKVSLIWPGLPAGHDDPICVTQQRDVLEQSPPYPRASSTQGGWHKPEQWMPARCTRNSLSLEHLKPDGEFFKRAPFPLCKFQGLTWFSGISPFPRQPAQSSKLCPGFPRPPTIYLPSSFPYSRVLPPPTPNHTVIQRRLNSSPT